MRADLIDEGARPVAGSANPRRLDNWICPLHIANRCCCPNRFGSREPSDLPSGGSLVSGQSARRERHRCDPHDPHLGLRGERGAPALGSGRGLRGRGGGVTPMITFGEPRELRGAGRSTGRFACAEAGGGRRIIMWPSPHRLILADSPSLRAGRPQASPYGRAAEFLRDASAPQSTLRNRSHSNSAGPLKAT